MSYDHMGRRREKNNQRFFYDGYLQVADNTGNSYTWDCTETIATRPLLWLHIDSAAYYVHDGSKNVSEVIASGDSIHAHYEYAPFGAVTTGRGDLAEENTWRFSSEYSEDDTATVYYNDRHYEPVSGRWLQRDPAEESYGGNLMAYCYNFPAGFYDFNGEQSITFSWTAPEIELPIVPTAGLYLVINNAFDGEIGTCCHVSRGATYYAKVSWALSLAARWGYKDKLGINNKGRLVRKDRKGRYHDTENGRYASGPVQSISDMYDEIVDHYIGNGRISIDPDSTLPPCPNDGLSGSVRGYIRGQVSVWGYGSSFDYTWQIWPDGSWAPKVNDTQFGRVGGGTQAYVDAGAEGEVAITHVF
jgi:RHS repeat-associated protein